MLVVAPQLLNTRKVASKLTTSSCSNAAVGEQVARRRIEPTNPHRRHGRRGRARSTAFAARELSIYLSISLYLSLSISPCTPGGKQPTTSLLPTYRGERCLSFARRTPAHEVR
eukprot:scaffold69605_cov63-Phaeocystis_antarctica.AAC.1